MHTVFHWLCRWYRSVYCIHQAWVVFFAAFLPKGPVSFVFQDIVRGSFKGFALLRQVGGSTNNRAPLGIPYPAAAAAVQPSGQSKPLYAPGYGLIPPSTVGVLLIRCHKALARFLATVNTCMNFAAINNYIHVARCVLHGKNLIAQSLPLGLGAWLVNGSTVAQPCAGISHHLEALTLAHQYAVGGSHCSRGSLAGKLCNTYASQPHSIGILWHGCVSSIQLRIMLIKGADDKSFQSQKHGREAYQCLPGLKPIISPIKANMRACRLAAMVITHG